MLGVFLFFIVFFIVIFGLIGIAINSAKDDGVEVKNNSVMRISLNYAIAERTDKNPFRTLNLPGYSSQKTIGLNDILTRIRHAKTDDRIKGIYLDLSTIGASYATIQEIRDALLDFKSSDKFINAYSEYYSQPAYYLASTADSIYLNPEGAIDFRGMASQMVFFKGTLDKLGIEAQIIKVGTYKSAVEPFILEKSSDANREQVNSYLNSLYQTFLQNISTSRDISRDSLHHIADQYLAWNAEKAIDNGLADELKYKDEILYNLKAKLNIDKNKKINAINIEDYRPSPSSSSTGDRLAVVYAVGEIVSGEGSDEQIGSERISRALRTAREDDKVKAVVLRVNSPGGSALASDVIWREVALTKKVKPIMVSMGDVAASGGYYISCAADSIFAQPNTITGSIGVFGIIPNMQKFFNDKLGITFDEVKTGQYANFQNLSRPLTASERSLLQQYVNQTYQTFTKKVADGRNIKQAYVDSIGQGRVWSGEQAVNIGLVDRLGSIQDAINAAARKAELDEYRIVSYPVMRDPFESLLGSGTDKLSTWFTQQQMGEAYIYYRQAMDVMQQSGIQARLPYTIQIQ